jgi:hypothetical protein
MDCPTKKGGHKASIYYILRITSNVGNRNSVLYWYLHIAGQQSSGSKRSDWL